MWAGASKDTEAVCSGFAEWLEVCAARLATKIAETKSNAVEPQGSRWGTRVDKDLRTFADFMATFPPIWFADSCSGFPPTGGRIIDQSGDIPHLGAGKRGAGAFFQVRSDVRGPECPCCKGLAQFD